MRVNIDKISFSIKPLFFKDKLKDLLLVDHNRYFRIFRNIRYQLLGHKKASERNRSKENSHKWVPHQLTPVHKVTRRYLY